MSNRKPRCSMSSYHTRFLSQSMVICTIPATLYVEVCYFRVNRFVVVALNSLSGFIAFLGSTYRIRLSPLYSFTPPHLPVPSQWVPTKLVVAGGVDQEA